MKVTESKIPDVLILEPMLHGDNRGYFMETFRASIFEERGIDLNFVQDNQSLSAQGTLRGLHYQHQHPSGQTGADNFR
jgi:dTDP-4-dehydrorhamnose 3,5-epimerase